MDITGANLEQLAAYLQKTLAANPVERRASEKFLESVEGNQNYSILLLELISQTQYPIHIRISASITFKNFIKRNWIVNELTGDRIHEHDRIIIKHKIVDMMLTSPEQIQKQLSDAISCIGKGDFPDKWPDLLLEMINKFQTGDFHIINGILQTAHSIFKRYRHEFKSETLWKEIKFVLDKFAEPFTQLANTTMELLTVHANNAQNLRIIYSSFNLIAKIFYSLNFQDLPEFFEDNMGMWMSHFHVLLTTNPILLSDNPHEPGVVEDLKSQICSNLVMYTQKYDEEFSSHLPAFVTDIWHLLTTTGSEAKYDLLVSNAIQFLATVGERDRYKNLFEDPTILSSICEKVIVPNMEFREADEEAFEENAEEYIRRDIEGSDSDTRRRAACDLVRSLSRSFEGIVIQNFSAYVNQMLQIYKQDENKNWKSKDAAIFLVTSLAAKAQTQKHGITQTSELVNVMEFFSNHIAPDLNSLDVDASPVLKADAIKYVIVFRNKLSAEMLQACMAPLVRFLLAKSHVVHSYAALCIEKLLLLKNANNMPLIGKNELSQLTEPLLTNLFTVLNFPGSLENEYAMKAMMRSMHILQEVIMPVIGTIISKLIDKLALVSKNPSKPHFNHYMFETLCISINIACSVDIKLVSTFEEHLFPVFQTLLQHDVQEFIPYVFQVLSLMLEKQGTSISDPYMLLFPHLLQPQLWERPGNIPGLIRLLQGYVKLGFVNGQIGADKLPGLLGIFQKLLASKSNDQFGFSLLTSIFTYIPENILSQYIQQVFFLIFQRLSNSKTAKYCINVVIFFCFYSVKYSALNLIQIIEKIQARMFGMVVEKLFLVELQNVHGAINRKTCAIGVANILSEVNELRTQNYLQLWPRLLDSLIKLLELAPEAQAFDETNTDENNFDGFQASYSQLSFVGKNEMDICVGVLDHKTHTLQQIYNICAQHSDIKQSLSELPPDTMSYLSQNFAKANLLL